jgi:heat-inducible transcriptional repressor
MENLTTRQLQLLKVIIEEYIETAEPVGSETLDKKYNLGVSPATIRNEMVKLTQSGYLKQPHTSAGRIPTPRALKLYVNQLMKTKELSVADEVSVKQKMLDYKSHMDKLLREATRALAVHTHTMSLATTDEGDIYTAGMGNILEMPEFFDIDITRHLLDTLDEYEYWWNVCSHCAVDPDNLAVLLGEELGSRFLTSCGGVFIRFQSPHHQGMIGVLGPSRLNFQKIVPMVRYVGHLISDISQQEGK